MWRRPRAPAGVGTILFRRETGVYEIIARDEAGLLHTLALFRRCGPVFAADTSLGTLPWPRDELEADLRRGRWQIAGGVPAGGALPGAPVRISWRFYARRMAIWPHTQLVEPHRNGQYRPVPELWRRGRRGAAVRWLAWSAGVTVAAGVATAPLFVAGQIVGLAAGARHLRGGGRRG
jgi:hypothetical protein